MKSCRQLAKIAISTLVILAAPLENLIPTAQAQYIPPVMRNPLRSQGSGSRGCDQDLQLAAGQNLITLLIPASDYAAQSISGHPTFFWHLSQPVSVPILFTLVEAGIGGSTVFTTQIEPPFSSGIMQVRLPETEAELESGKIYRWSVAVLCNPQRPSTYLTFQSWIEIVPETAALKEKLASLNNESVSERATIYAQEGLWYDSLATMFQADQDSLFSLLQSVGLESVILNQNSNQ